MIATPFESFDYVLSKEYNTILLRRHEPLKHSYVRSIIFDDRNKLSSEKSIILLYKELLELHESCIGQHKNRNLETIKENVRVEISDCIFRLMILDVSLGGDDYDDINWVKSFVDGAEFTSPISSNGMTNIIASIRTLANSKPEQARQRLVEVMTYLGMITSAYELSLLDIIGEIQLPYRWSRHEKDLGKRMVDITTGRDKQTEPKEQWNWFKDNLPVIAQTAIVVIKEMMK